MAAYTVRVELHNADWDDYESLHKAMARAGYNKFIIGSNGVRFELPTAEYDLPSTTLNVSEVRDQALAIAAQIQPRPVPWVLVTHSAGRSWSTKALGPVR